MEEKRSLWSEFTKGIIKENPVLRLILGCCATLAVTTAASNAIGMGAATTFVLVCSNAAISLLRNVIPNKVRIPAFITIIAGFVTVVQLFIKAFSPALDTALGVFLPLIVVNCIILGRAEAYASKNPPLLAGFDGIGMGLGFSIALTCMGFFRELIGAGTVFSGTSFAYSLPKIYEPISIFVLAPGAFLVLALIIAFLNAMNIENNGNKKVDGCGRACGTCKKAPTCDKAARR